MTQAMGLCRRQVLAGTLGHYADILKRITDAAFKEGEHAE